MPYKDPMQTRVYAAAYRAEHREEARGRSAAYYAAHREELQAKQAASSAAHPEKARARTAAWYATHRKEKQAYNMAYRAAHRKERKLYAQAYYMANQKKTRAAHIAYYAATREERLAAVCAYQAAHPEAGRANSARRRARKKNAPINDLTRAQWIEMQAAYDHRCVYCGQRHKGKLTQDHIQPLSKGGSHTVSNVVPACSACNRKKHTGPVLSPIQPLLLTSA